MYNNYNKGGYQSPLAPQQPYLASQQNNYNPMSSYNYQPPPSQYHPPPSQYQPPPSQYQPPPSSTLNDYHNHKQVDLEQVLEQEKRKAKELRDKVETELEQERRLRMDFEQKTLKHQNEQQQRENLIHELDFKLASMAQENQSLAQENYGLKEEIGRLQDNYSHQTQHLETQLQENQQSFQEYQFNVQQQNQKLQQEHSRRVDSQQREYEDRLQQADERILSLMANNRELEEQNKYVQKSIVQLKVNTEDEIREITNRVQQEEYQKYMMNLRTLENKLQQSEQQKEQMNRKNQDLVKELQQKDHKLRTEYMEMERLNGKGQLEIQDMQNQLIQADMHLGKLRAELHQKDNLIHKIQSDYAALQTGLDKQKQILKQESDDLIGQLQTEKRYDQDVKDQLNRRIAEVEQQLQNREVELSRLNEEYQKLCNGLQSNINQTIYKTMNNMHYTPSTNNTKYINKYQ